METFNLKQITMAQQTAVEWLQEQLNPDMKTMQGHIIQDLLEQAKQMEKEQTEISDAGKNTADYIDRHIIESMKELAIEGFKPQKHITKLPMPKKKETPVTLREKLVGTIIAYSGDEYETKEDLTALAMMSEEQLTDRVMDILDYYYEAYNKLND